MSGGRETVTVFAQVRTILAHPGRLPETSSTLVRNRTCKCAVYRIAFSALRLHVFGMDPLQAGPTNGAVFPGNTGITLI